MQFGAIIIGDEILSGKRQDKHLRRVIETLGMRGLPLAWAQYLGDDADLITGALRRTLGGSDAVLSFGGIGATPDDHTRQCAARAAGVELRLHPQAEAEIRARFVNDPVGATPQRLAMGEFPAGSEIIPNAYNRIPGFSFGHHHFSLPRIDPNDRHIELGVRGVPEEVKAAIASLKEGVSALGFRWSDPAQPSL